MTLFRTNSVVELLSDIPNLSDFRGKTGVKWWTIVPIYGLKNEHDSGYEEFYNTVTEFGLPRNVTNKQKDFDKT
jgi:hypothetical protein